MSIDIVSEGIVGGKQRFYALILKEVLSTKIFPSTP